MTDDELAAIARNTPGTDCLEERGLFGDAETLRLAPARAALLERAVVMIERQIRDAVANWAIPLDSFGHRRRDQIALIAEHRGETPEATLARLGPVTIPTVWATTDSAPIQDLLAMRARSRDQAIGMGNGTSYQDALAFLSGRELDDLYRQRPPSREAIDELANLPVRAPEPVQMTVDEFRQAFPEFRIEEVESDDQE